MKNNQAQIYEALAMLSVVLNQPQDSKRLMFYAEALKEYDLRAVLGQIKGFSMTTKYFPQLVEIIEPLSGLDVPTDELAITIASEILKCAERFAAHDIAGARKYLGDKFEIAQRFGWETLCRLEYSELPATRAQLRDLAKAYINRSKRDVRDGISIGLNINTESRPIGEEKKETGLKLLKF